MMQGGNYDKPRPGNVSFIQEIEECSKKMESSSSSSSSSLELQVQSYKKNLLKFGCERAEIRENGYWINSRLGVIEGISENFTPESDDSYGKIESVKGNGMKRGLGGDNVEERVLAGKECCSVDSTNRTLELSEHMNCSSSLCEKDMVSFGGEKVLEGSSGSKSSSDSRKGKVGFPLNEVEELRTRLQILEEDNQMMKQAFFAGVEERSGLLNEISQQFQILQQYLNNLTIGEKLSLGLLTNSNKDESMATGLSKVLHQDSNPSLVTRVFKANVLAFQENQDPSATGAI